MKIVLGFVATAALALAMGGCSSSPEDDGFGGDPDLSGVRSRFDQPDGTLSEGNAAKVLEQGTNGSSSTGDLNFAGGPSGGGSVSTKSTGLQLLDASSLKPAAGGFAGCSALASGQQSGSCACPSGGSIDYIIRANGQGGGASNALMKFRLNACASGDTTIDGTEYIEVSTNTANQQRPVYSMLLVIDATVTNRGVTKKLDLQWRYANGATEFAAKVDDGWVVVSIKQSASGTGGTWTVRDRNGSWTCTVDDGHGSCTSDKGVTKKW